MPKLIIISAPSGSGKSTIINSIMTNHPELHLAFSISCTTRPPRGNEQDGIEYHFITPDQFRHHIDNGDFIEYEEVYKDIYYGTLKSQIEKQSQAGQTVVFDVDVNGGIRLKEHFKQQALSIFIQPPSIDTLRQRLEKRGTDTPEVIDDRIARAQYELSQAHKFDKIIVNDDLQTALNETYHQISNFLK